MTTMLRTSSSLEINSARYRLMSVLGLLAATNSMLIAGWRLSKP